MMTRTLRSANTREKNNLCIRKQSSLSAEERKLKQRALLFSQTYMVSHSKLNPFVQNFWNNADSETIFSA